MRNCGEEIIYGFGQGGSVNRFPLQPHSEKNCSGSISTYQEGGKCLFFTRPLGRVNCTGVGANRIVVVYCDITNLLLIMATGWARHPRIYTLHLRNCLMLGVRIGVISRLNRASELD